MVGAASGLPRKTLNAGQCDLVTSTTNGIEMLRTTRPIYRSGFVFVTREDGPRITSLDDPILHKLKVGIQLVGEDGANPPPAEALARRGIVDNVKGYMVYGDYRDEAPASNIMKAVAKGDIDVAIVWGPLAGYFSSRESVPLRLTFVTPQIDGPRLPMAFDANMGVRRTDRGLLEDVNAALAKLKPQIDAILADYGVPRLDMQAADGIKHGRPGGDDALITPAIRNAPRRTAFFPEERRSMMTHDVTRREEQRGWRIAYLWAIPGALVVGLVIVVALYWTNVGAPDTGMQKTTTSGAIERQPERRLVRRPSRQNKFRNTERFSPTTPAIRSISSKATNRRTAAKPSAPATRIARRLGRPC